MADGERILTSPSLKFEATYPGTSMEEGIRSCQTLSCDEIFFQWLTTHVFTEKVTQMKQQFNKTRLCCRTGEQPVECRIAGNQELGTSNAVVGHGAQSGDSTWRQLRF